MTDLKPVTQTTSGGSWL